MTQTRSTPPQIQIPSRRVALLLAGMLIALGAICARTLWLETVRGASLEQSADRQQLEQRVLPAVRGDIVDRDGRALAIGEEAITFAGDPTQIKDPAGTALKVSRVLGLAKADEEALIARMTAATGRFVYIARQVSRDKAKVLQDLELRGIYPYDEEKRMYPNGLVAGQLLGAVNIDGQGIDGLESLYETSLSGTPGAQLVVRDPDGVPIDVLKLRRESDGKDVQLTIDLRIQAEAERVLAQAVRNSGAKAASAIVMNPRTGEILAMANVPRANPGKWGKTPAANRRNRIVTDTYEPGSTFKIVAVSGALEEKKVVPSTRMTLPPTLRFCNEKKNCTVSDSHPRGTVTMSVKDILVESSNVGTIKIARDKLGSSHFYRWMGRFGFGSSTGIDFPGESAGTVAPMDQWSSVSIGNFPIGQGITVTPIQVASAYAAIANDGIVVQPHILERIGNETVAAHPSKRILSSETARTMRALFGGVVKDERGTGTLANIPGYDVGGKTGTAAFVEDGKYVKGRYHSSFVGFVPANNPKLVTLVVVNDTTEYGGDAAAPAFEAISEFALKVLAIPPDGMT